SSASLSQDDSGRGRHPPARDVPSMSGSNLADCDSDPLSSGDGCDQLDYVWRFLGYPEDAMALVRVVGLRIDWPRHNLFSRSGIHKLLLADGYRHLIIFISIFRKRREPCLESLGKRESR